MFAPWCSGVSKRGLQKKGFVFVLQGPLLPALETEKGLCPSVDAGLSFPDCRFPEVDLLGSDRWGQDALNLGMAPLSLLPR